MRKSLPVVLVLAAVLACPFAPGRAEGHARHAAQHRPGAGRVVVDALVLRPVGAAGLVIGTGATILAMPVTIPTRSTHEVSRKLVRKPYDFTFRRPLGVW